jgi:hypothetical protein
MDRTPGETVVVAPPQPDGVAFLVEPVLTQVDPAGVVLAHAHA